MIKTVLFDLDGTMTRSGLGITSCAQYAAGRVHHTREPEDWTKFIGPPLFDSFRDFCGMTEAEAETAVNVYRERFTRIGWEENAVYEGIPALLRSLKINGIHAVIVTSKVQELSVRIAKRFGLMPLIEEVVGPGPEERHPEKDQLIARAMAKYPGPYVMVGDRKFDIDGAKACGIASIGVTYGYGSEEELREHQADQLAASPLELEQLLLGDLPRARGLFLTMEGVDGCGKSTQREALVEELKKLGWRITMTREPGGDAVAEKIRALILDPENRELGDVTEAYLYAASRAQNTRALIMPALCRGDLVVCDRYVDSSIAYQGGGRELGTERIRRLNEWAVEGCMPDLTIYLRMEPQKALARRLEASQPDRLEQEKDTFFERTYEAYEAIYAEDQGQRMIAVDASRSIPEVSKEMLERVRERLAVLQAEIKG